MFAVLALSLPLVHFAGVPLMTFLTLMTSLGTSSYLDSRHQRYLGELRPVLDVDDAAFSALQQQMNNFHRPTYIIAAAIAPTAFLGANWSNPRLHELLAGHIDIYMIISLLCALFTWAIFTQTVVFVASRSRFFNRLGRDVAVVDLANTGCLAPFMKVGLSTFLVFALGYTLTPIGIVQHSQAMTIMLVGCGLSLPIALSALLVPVFTVRTRIRDAKAREIQLVNRALQGDRDSLADSMLAQERDSLKLTNLLFFRSWLENLSDWPVDDSASRKLISYVVVPVLSWSGAFVFEMWLETQL